VSPQFNNLGFGVGLRSQHYAEILDTSPAIDWFEVLSDNYLYTRGRPLDYLDKISAKYPVAMHGVGLSIGSTDPLDIDYVKRLKQLSSRCDAHWVSDHFAWTGVQGLNGHDLYPLPYTSASLQNVVNRVQQVQEILGKPLVLENPSTYLQFAANSMDEASFIREVLQQTGAGLLLDVNNIYVNSKNHGFDAHEYLKRLPLERVVQFHVAGHSLVEESLGDTGPTSYLIDTHSAHALPEVWALLGAAIRLGAAPCVLVEWDAEIPELSVLVEELARARAEVAAAQGALLQEVQS
jgi:uncharacterized protein